MIGRRSRYLTETVTFTGRRLRVDADGKPVRDARGNDIYDEVPYTLGPPQAPGDVDRGCSVQPRGAAPESTDQRDQVIEGLTVYCADPNAPVDVKDKATWNGADYEVDGPIERFTGALMASNNHCVIVLKKVSG